MGFRIRTTRVDNCDADTRRLLEATPGAEGGRVLNLFATLAHHPKLLRSWLVFGEHVFSGSSLPARERELVILRVGRLCRCEYEWAHHVAIARRVGVSEEEIRRVAAGPEASGWEESVAALLRAVDELHSETSIGDGTWEALAARFSTEQLLDLVFTVGQYTLAAMALNALRVELDPGLEGEGLPE